MRIQQEKLVKLIKVSLAVIYMKNKKIKNKINVIVFRKPFQKIFWKIFNEIKLLNQAEYQMQMKVQLTVICKHKNHKKKCKQIEIIHKKENFMVQFFMMKIKMT